MLGEHLNGLVHGQLQHLGNRAALPDDRQRLRVIAGPVARRARRVDAGHEQQLYADETLAFASRATALGDVERKLPGVIPRFLSFGCGGVELAHVVEQSSIGREVGTRSAANGLLIDLHQTLD
ncbi:hypothetical protein D3C86_1643810 [compost metagenome]